MLFWWHLTGKVGLALLLLMPLFCGLQVLYKRRQTNPWRTLRCQSGVNTLVNETMNGSSIIQLTIRKKSVLQQFDQVAGQMRASGWPDCLGRLRHFMDLDRITQILSCASILTFIGYQFLAGNSDVTARSPLSLYQLCDHPLWLAGMLVRSCPIFNGPRPQGGGSWNC